MTDHSSTPPQVEIHDIPPTKDDLLSWAAKIIVALPGMTPELDHQRQLWLKSYHLHEEERRRTNTILMFDENHDKVVGTTVFGEGEGFVHSHGLYSMHSHKKGHDL